MSLPGISQDEFNYLNFALSVIGSLTGIIALGYTIHRARKEDARVKIKYQPNMLLQSDLKNPIVLINVINIGYKPIKVSNVSLCIVNKNGQKSSLTLEKWLNPVVLTVENPNAHYTIPESVAQLDKLWFITVNDIRGKSTRLYVRKLKRLWRVYVKIKYVFRKIFSQN